MAGIKNVYTAYFNLLLLTAQLCYVSSLKIVGAPDYEVVEPPFETHDHNQILN